MPLGATCLPTSKPITIGSGSTPPSATSPPIGRGNVRVIRCPLFRGKLALHTRACQRKIPELSRVAAAYGRKPCRTHPPRAPEDVLRQVQADRANLRQGRLLLSGDKRHHWHTKAVGEVSTPSQRSPVANSWASEQGGRAGR